MRLSTALMRSSLLLMRPTSGSMLRSRTTSNSLSPLKDASSAVSLRFWSAAARSDSFLRSRSSCRAFTCSGVGVGSILRITAPLALISYRTTFAHASGGVSPMCVTPLLSTHLYDATAGAANAIANNIKILLIFFSRCAPCVPSWYCDSVLLSIFLDALHVAGLPGARTQRREDVRDACDGGHRQAVVAADFLRRRELALPAFLAVQGNQHAGRNGYRVADEVD